MWQKWQTQGQLSQKHEYTLSFGKLYDFSYTSKVADIFSIMYGKNRSLRKVIFMQKCIVPNLPEKFLFPKK
jgi:hypothetical protein